MLYSEFIENVKCRDTNYNYGVYKNIEIIYMNNDNFSKEDFYNYGKKLVNNELTEEEKEKNKATQELIDTAKNDIEIEKDEITYYKTRLKYAEKNSPDYFRYKADLIEAQNVIKDRKEKIAQLKLLIIE